VANNVTDLLIGKNYLQKINKSRKQVKKMMPKQATMGMQAQKLLMLLLRMTYYVSNL